MRVLIATIALWLAIGLLHALCCDESVQLHVSPETGFGMQRQVRIEVRIHPVASDRVLVLEIDDGLYSRHSEMPIDGANAAKLQTVTWRDVPPGQYSLIAALGTPAHLRARDTKALRFLPID